MKDTRQFNRIYNLALIAIFTYVVFGLNQSGAWYLMVFLFGQYDIKGRDYE